MYCPACGKKQPENAIFCYSCGRKIEIPKQDDDSLSENMESVSTDKISIEDAMIEVQEEQKEEQEKFPALQITEDENREERRIGEELIGIKKQDNLNKEQIVNKHDKVERIDALSSKTSLKPTEVIDNYEKEKGTGVKVFVIILIIGILIYSVGYLMKKIDESNNKPFESETMMKNTVNGIYTFYKKDSFTDKMEPYYTLNISEEMIIKRFNPLLDWHGTAADRKYHITKWDYTNRVIETVKEEYYTRGEMSVKEPVEVLSNGNIVFGDDTYKKGGEWEKSETIENRHNQFLLSIKSRDETIESAIEITVDKLSPPYDSSYQKCTGTIKNTGVNTYKYVKLKGVFKDKYGNVIDTDWTYGVDSEGIAPGESKKFELSVKKDRSIDSCSVSILKDD